MKHILLFLLLTGCSMSSLPVDYADNYAHLGYRNIEFNNNSSPLDPPTKQLGNATIMLIEQQRLEGLFFEVVGTYKGTLTLFSQGCPWLNWVVPYEGIRRFYLIDLMPEPTSCQIRITEMPDQINGMQHNVVEFGIVDIFVLPTGKKATELSYLVSNQFGIKQNKSIGNIALQHRDGPFVNSDQITMQLGSNSGLYSIRSTCYPEAIQGDYNTNSLKFSLKTLYKDYEAKDCDFNFVFIPKDEPDSYYAKVVVNVYDKKAVMLEYPKFEVYDKHKLRVTGANYIAVTCIDDFCSYQDDKGTNIVHIKHYNPTATYYIRAITTNGRKAVFGMKDGKVVWW